MRERRGGYCFEQNLLLAAALRTLGAEVAPLLGRVVLGSTGAQDASQRPRTHLALRVAWEGEQRHADVGFGRGTLLEPLPFGRPDEVFEQSGWRFRVRIDHARLILQAATEAGWADQYVLDPELPPMIDVETSNWFAATHPTSPFSTGLLVSRNRADGSRLTLSDFGPLALIEDRPGASTTTPIERGAVPGLLQTRFGLPGFALHSGGRLVKAGQLSRSVAPERSAVSRLDTAGGTASALSTRPSSSPARWAR